MPADLRIEKERALIGYQRDLEEVEEIKKRSEMISKYHFVRFLGRPACPYIYILFFLKKELTNKRQNANEQQKT